MELRTVSAALFLTIVQCVLREGHSTLYLDDYCGSKITNAGDRLQSQKSDYYGNDINCELTIQAPVGFDYFILKFEWLDMESSPSGMPTCYDFVEVYDGYSPYDSDMLLRKCTTHVSHVISSGDVLTLRMRSDETSVSVGFSLIFTAYHAGPCTDVDHYSCSSSNMCIHSSLVCDCHDNCPYGDDEECGEPCTTLDGETDATEMSTLAIACMAVAAVLIMASVLIVVIYVYRLKKDQRQVEPINIDVATTPRTIIVDNVGEADTSKETLIAPPTAPKLLAITPATCPTKRYPSMSSPGHADYGTYVETTDFKPLFDPNSSKC